MCWLNRYCKQHPFLNNQQLWGMLMITQVGRRPSSVPLPIFHVSLAQALWFGEDGGSRPALRRSSHGNSLLGPHMRGATRPGGAEKDEAGRLAFQVMHSRALRAARSCLRAAPVGA